MTPMLLALPVPSWHTDTSKEGYTWLAAQPSEELFGRLEIQQNFTRFLVGLPMWTYLKGVSVMHQPLKGGYPMRDLGRAEADNLYTDAQCVEDRIARILLGRYQDELRKRDLGRQKAKWTRMAKRRVA